MTQWPLRSVARWLLAGCAACSSEPGSSSVGPEADGATEGPPTPCQSDQDCTGVSRCGASAQPAIDLEPVLLSCRPLDTATDGTECQAAEECSRGLCLLAGTCAAPCSDDASCATDQWCTSAWARTGPVSFQPVRACVPVFSGARDVSVSRQVLTERLRGGGPGQLDRVSLPAVEATSLLALLPSERAADPFFVRLTTREQPPRTLFDFDTLDTDSPTPSFGVNPGVGVPALLLPNGPNAVLSSEGYVAEIESVSPAALELRTLTRRGRGSLLDLHLYFVGGGGFISSPDGSLPPALEAAIDEFRVVFARAGIEVGTVRTHDVRGALQERFRVIEEGPFDLEMLELFTLSAGATGPGVNWFFTESLGSGVLGWSGGIPGPQGMHGTVSSGIAFGVAEALRAERLSNVLIHETAHYLGLFHTAELRGVVTEPLPDTPECRIDRDANGNGFLDPGECIGRGEDNPMHWASLGTGDFTDDQAEVLRNALLLR